MKYTIQDLADGKCAVKNDSTLEDLREVLKLAFPEDYFISGGHYKYYLLSTHNELKWDSSDNTSLPTQSAKDFLIKEETYKRGETVLVRDKDSEPWKDRIFISEIKGAKLPFICVHSHCVEAFKNGGKFETTNWEYIKKKTNHTIIIEGAEVEVSEEKLEQIKNLIDDLRPF